MEKPKKHELLLTLPVTHRGSFLAIKIPTY